MTTRAMPPQVAVIGGGMIVHDQILPSLYHLQRTGVIGEITVCATSSQRLRELVNPTFEHAFPDQSFRAYPNLTDDLTKRYPELYKKVIAALPAGSVVVVAVPETHHMRMITEALQHNHHVLCVKPLVMNHGDAETIRKLAHDKGLFVGIDYHKRFDRRNLEAKVKYHDGRFGRFRCGEAKLIEPWYYRDSNFQTWFTKENTDPFVYVGCHYVDLVYFITGHKPVEVSLRGVEGTFPNGNVGYLWSAARVLFDNGALFNVINGLGYPNEAAGTNDQGMTLFCEGSDGDTGKASGGMIVHNDLFRGVSHSYIDKQAGAAFRFVNPDYFRLVAWEHDGLKPVGYGYDSIEANLLAAIRVMRADNLESRQHLLTDIDERGILATPANSAFNELVTEAARLSITHDGRPATITYGQKPGVNLR